MGSAPKTSNLIINVGGNRKGSKASNHIDPTEAVEYQKLMCDPRDTASVDAEVQRKWASEIKATYPRKTNFGNLARLALAADKRGDGVWYSVDSNGTIR